MADRALLAAATCFAGVTAAGAVLAVREDIPGEPLGLQVPGPVTAHLAMGLGAGLSAPWPMPVATLAAAVSADATRRWPGRICSWVGAGLVAGTLVEPVTWKRRPASRAALATVPLNLACGLALAVLGRRAVAAAIRPRRM